MPVSFLYGKTERLFGKKVCEKCATIYLEGDTRPDYLKQKRCFFGVKGYVRNQLYVTVNQTKETAMETKTTINVLSLPRPPNEVRYSRFGNHDSATGEQD